MLKQQIQTQGLNSSTEAVQLQIDSCVAAGYTGRNQDMVRAHIDELKKLGVAAPYAIPALYWICPSRLTQCAELQVIGEQTSPEVEYFLAEDNTGELHITVASDHTDRKLEAVSVGKAKQICSKVLGDHFWRVADVTEHWDDIKLQSRVLSNNEWVPYQTGTLAQILHYQDLLELIRRDSPVGKHPALLSGTVPVINGDPIYTAACEISIEDPILNRAITKRYGITVLPDRS